MSAFEITGPGVEKPKVAPVIGAALSYAQGQAGRLAREGTFYVRRDGRVVAHVNRLGDGVVETRMIQKEAS